MSFLRLLRSGISKSINLGLGLFITVFVLKVFGAEYYGAYASLISELFIFSFIVKLGFDILVLKEQSSRFLVTKTVPVYLLIFGSLLLISLILLPIYGPRFITIVLFGFTLVISEFLRRQNRTDLYIMMTGGFQYVIQLTIFSYSYFFDTTPTADLVIFESILIPFCILLIGGRSVLWFSSSQIRQVSASEFWKMFNESFGQMTFNLTSVLNNWLGTYLLGFVGSAVDVAIYSSVKRITKGISFPEQVLNVSFANPLARSIGTQEKLDQVLNKQRKWYFLAFTIVLIIGIVLEPYLFDLLNVSREFETEVKAVYFISLLMVLVNILTGPTFIFTRLSGRITYKALVIFLITIVCYSLIFTPIFKPAIRVSIIALASLSTANIYLMIEAFINKKVRLYAKPF